jgi:hypothetical protein
MITKGDMDKILMEINQVLKGLDERLKVLEETKQSTPVRKSTPKS